MDDAGSVWAVISASFYNLVQSVSRTGICALYVYQARPRTEEMLVDEMLAICAEIETWRQKKESQEAQARYNAWLCYRKYDEDEEE